ncbi:hypothetical protein QCA50_000388 [Cerrena zonata]|uniref:Uncharacterized protein n=1 Tax=Cerrena zonata TaxID=2478898 RepID=A0AAW0GQI6_9APHY
MSPRALSPRVAILTRGFVVNLIVPISLVWIGSRLLDALGYHKRTWLLVLTQVASIPVFAAARTWFQLWTIDRRAARSGGVLPPRYVGHGIGDIGTLKDFMEIHWKTGYLGDGLSDVLTTHGPTFDLRVMWEHSIITTDANIIKTVLATDFPNWVKGDVFQEYMYSVLGTGVFNSDGQFILSQVLTCRLSHILFVNN